MSFRFCHIHYQEFYLLYDRNSRLWTPLECAASKGWIRCVRVLLDANCPIDSMDRAKVPFFYPLIFGYGTLINYHLCM